MIRKIAGVSGLALGLAGCGAAATPGTPATAPGACCATTGSACAMPTTAPAAVSPSGKAFGDDAAFAAKHTPIVELTDDTGEARVIVAPALQGRVLTSTCSGQAGPAFGWINKELLASGKLGPHINAFGGEDRFWVGPEGGQFSVYFAPGAAFDLQHWQTPAPIDTEAYDVVSKDKGQVSLKHEFSLTNYSGTKLDVRVERQVKLLTPAEAWNALKVDAGANVKLVAFESSNKLTNAGKEPWTRVTGLLSIWILGMFNASPDAVVLVPYKQGPESEMGPMVQSGYFGDVPPERLATVDGVVYFRADSHFRSKIGVSPARAKGVEGSYDSGKKVLTLVQYTLPQEKADYVNSQWKLQDNPFSGDVANAYNDGPNSLGSQMGQFYEMESSSPAAELAPGQTIEHVQRTIHLTGDEAELNRIAQAVLGVTLADIPKHLPAPSK